MNEKGFNLKFVIIIIFTTSIIAAITTGVIVGNNYRNASGMTYAEIIEDKDLSEFLSVYAQIIEKYYGDYDKGEMLKAASAAILNSNANSKKELLNVATEAMITYLGDDYSNFFDQESASNLNETLSGTYSGIGVTIQGRNIISVSDNSPAQSAGIMPGDVIIKINEQEISEAMSSVISIIIKDENKSEVDIYVDRNGETLMFNVQKTQIDNATSYTMVDETEIGYIKINIFSENLDTSFDNAITKLEKEGMKSLIIDLRGNSGGYLDKAVSIASIFSKKGALISTVKSVDSELEYKDTTNEYRSYEIVVLIDNETASASEMLAASLKFNNNATLIGEQSYGKGTVQQIINQSDGTTMKYTTAKWYTPSSICIDGSGIIPDIFAEYEVIRDENEVITEIIDQAYIKALEILRNE